VTAADGIKRFEINDDAATGIDWESSSEARYSSMR